MTPPDPVHDGIRCLLMRGGTSKGAFFLAGDLPADPSARDDLLLRIMGSPDPRQIDGIGGAHPLTSKVAVVSASASPDADIDYLFLQVGVDEPVVADAQTCGNLLSAVGPFAAERGLIGLEPGLTTVRIRLLNTGDLAQATFATEPSSGGGLRVRYDGDVAIDGVPGTASGIALEVTPGPDKALLPTGSVRDEFAGVPMTLIDNGMPVALIPAHTLGLSGDEHPAALEADAALHDRIEQLRLAAGLAMGLGEVADQTVPKMILLSAARHGGAIATRAFIPRRVHASLGVLMAASVAAGIRIPGAVGSDLAVLTDSEETVIEHPSGRLVSRVRVREADNGTWTASSLSLRTARPLFDGRVFARPHR